MACASARLLRTMSVQACTTSAHTFRRSLASAISSLCCTSMARRTKTHHDCSVRRFSALFLRVTMACAFNRAALRRNTAACAADAQRTNVDAHSAARCLAAWLCAILRARESRRTCVAHVPKFLFTIRAGIMLSMYRTHGRMRCRDALANADHPYVAHDSSARARARMHAAALLRAMALMMARDRHADAAARTCSVFLTRTRCDATAGRHETSKLQCEAPRAHVMYANIVRGSMSISWKTSSEKPCVGWMRKRFATSCFSGMFLYMLHLCRRLRAHLHV
jgi:hypothetical protein